MDVLAPAVGFGVIGGSILAIAALGFTLQFGVTNVLNLAFGEVMISAAYLAWLADDAGLPIWVALVIAAVTGAILSFVLNRLLYMPFIRRGIGLFGMIIVALAVSLIAQNVLQIVFGARFYTLNLAPGPTYHVLGMVFTRTQVAIIVIAAISVLMIYLVLRRTRLGKTMRATAADPALARTCGIPTDRVIGAAWLISGALCGIAGVTFVVNLGSFQSTTGGEILVPIVAAAILGGVGHPYGAVLGALTVAIASELAAAVLDPAYKAAFAFVVLIAVLLIRPQGIFAEVAREKEVVA
jgi:branched-chain amino acid transport system permease protein/neutral amino acid transport system permease protein